MRSQMFPRPSALSVVLILILFASLLHPLPLHAGGVLFYTSATIQAVPAGAPVPLPLGAAAAFSVPAGGLATLTVTGVAAAGAGAVVSSDLIDEDVFFDDTLEVHTAIAGAGGAFTIVFHLRCNGATLEGGWPPGEIVVSSGEQTAEIAVEDGSQHIPVGTTWAVACDKATTSRIGYYGGVVELPWADSTAVVDIPYGALVAETQVNLLNALPIPNQTSVPAGLLPISEALRIEPQSLELQVPASVELPYTHGEIEGYDESGLQVLEFDSRMGTWHVISSTLDSAANVLSFQVSRFGTFGFAGPSTRLSALHFPLAMKADATVSLRSVK